MSARPRTKERDGRAMPAGLARVRDPVDLLRVWAIRTAPGLQLASIGPGAVPGGSTDGNLAFAAWLRLSAVQAAAWRS